MRDIFKPLKGLGNLIKQKAASDKPATGSSQSVSTPWHRRHMASVWQKRPPFSLTFADLMTFDQQVWFGLAVGNGPLLSAEVEVEGDNAEVVEFVGEQWDRLWSSSAGQILRAKHYGYMAYEVMYRQCRGGRWDGRYEFDRLIDRHPIDCRPLVLKDGGKQVGVAFHNIQEAGAGVRRLWGPQALWLTYGAEHDSLFGTALLERAFDPWYEKTMESGAKRMRQLRMIKDAWRGDVIWYDKDEKFITEAGAEISAQQIAMEMGENIASGGTQVYPMRYDANGNQIKIFDYKEPTAVSGATQINEWVHDLDWDIFDGLLVPREVVEAATSGSGFSGRSIPFLTFLSIRDEEFSADVRQIKSQLIDPLVAANYGAPAAKSYEIRPKPLLETVGKQMGPMGKPDTMEGTDGQPAQQGGRFGQPGQQQPQRVPPQAGAMRGPMQFAIDTSETVARVHRRLQQLLPPFGLQFSAEHAPSGGITIAGKHFDGGEFIPGEVMKKASKEEKAELASKRSASPTAEDWEALKEAGLKTPRHVSRLKSILVQPKPADLEKPSIVLWHGTTLRAAKSIANSQYLRQGPRGINAAATIDDAAQYPEENGADALVILEADTSTLSVDPNDQQGATVADGLFPKSGYGSAATVGKHRVLAVIDVRTETDRKAAFEAIQAGNLIDLAYSGATVLYLSDPTSNQAKQ